MKLTKPLKTRLRGAHRLLLDWRRTLYDSERNRARDRSDGFTGDPAVDHELARFKVALDAINEAIRELP